MGEQKNLWEMIAERADGDMLPELAAVTIQKWEASDQTPEFAELISQSVEALICAFGEKGLDIPDDIAEKFSEILFMAQVVMPKPFFGSLDMSLNGPGKGFGGPGVC